MREIHEKPVLIPEYGLGFSPMTHVQGIELSIQNQAGYPETYAVRENAGFVGMKAARGYLRVRTFARELTGRHVTSAPDQNF